MHSHKAPSSPFGVPFRNDRPDHTYKLPTLRPRMISVELACVPAVNLRDASEKRGHRTLLDEAHGPSEDTESASDECGIFRLRGLSWDFG